MLKESRAEALRWLNQAENDLSYAALGISGGFYAQVCFQCQQIAEKAKEAYQTAEKIIKIAKDQLPKGDIQEKANG